MNTLLSSSVSSSSFDVIFRFLIFVPLFIGELLIASALTFQDVFNICEAYIKETSNGDNMLRFIFTAIEKRHGAPKLQQIFASSNCNLEIFISDGNLNRWLENNVSECYVMLMVNLIIFSSNLRISPLW